jgi:hypothetical protein
MNGILIGNAINRKIAAICGGFIKESIQKSIESGKQLFRSLIVI